MNQRSIKNGQIVKTHEITIVDPITGKARRITPTTGGLFVLRFEGVYIDGKTAAVEELPINMGDDLVGCEIYMTKPKSVSSTSLASSNRSSGR